MTEFVNLKTSRYRYLFGGFFVVYLGQEVGHRLGLFLCPQSNVSGDV